MTFSVIRILNAMLPMSWIIIISLLCRNIDSAKPTPRPTPRPTVFVSNCPSGYIQCAMENSYCSNTGIIAFGAQTRYTYQQSPSNTTTSPVLCSSAIFGDPIVGSTKECCYQTPLLTEIKSPIVGTISCEETIYSFFGYNTDTHFWKLTTTNPYHITYTTCGSSFDTRVHIYNSQGSIISLTECPVAPTSTANPAMTGDDCNEDACGFIDSNNEYFTMLNQEPDIYYIEILAYIGSTYGYGNYQLSVSCAVAPTTSPTQSTLIPTNYPSKSPTNIPSSVPTINGATQNPSKSPTNIPSLSPTETSGHPTFAPSIKDSKFGTKHPTFDPTVSPTPILITAVPTQDPDNAIWCISIVEIIENLMGIETNDFLQDPDLILFTVNSTKLAIYDAVNMDVLCNNVFECFILKVTTIGGVSEIVLNIDVCAWNENVYNALLDKFGIETYRNDMSALMIKQLKSYFNNNINTDNLMVTISMRTATTTISINTQFNKIAQSDKNNTNTIPIVVVVVLLILILFIIMMIFLYYKRKKNYNKEAVELKTIVQMGPGASENIAEPGSPKIHNVLSSGDEQDEKFSNTQNEIAENNNNETSGRFYSPEKQEDDIYSDEVNGVEPIIKKEDKWKYAHVVDKTPKNEESMHNDNNNKQAATIGNNSGQISNGEELPKGESDNNDEHTATEYI